MSMVAENMRSAELRTLIEQSRSTHKPDLAEMRAWVERHDPALLQSADAYREVYGEFHPDQVRTITVVRQLIEFLGGCQEHQEAITTVFRAAAHRKQWRRG